MSKYRIGFNSATQPTIDGIQSKAVYVVGTSFGPYDGSQTTFPFTYSPTYVDVFLNGTKLIRNEDYDASSGTEVVLTSDAPNDAYIELVAYGKFQIADTFQRSQNLADADDISAIRSNLDLVKQISPTDTTPNRLTITDALYLGYRIKGPPVFVTESGPYDPPSDSRARIVELLAGGASGSASDTTKTGEASAGSGGGAGEYAIKFIDGNASATIIIGAGGNGPAGGFDNFQDGNDSSYDDGTNYFDVKGGEGMAGLIASPSTQQKRQGGEGGIGGIGGDLHIQGGHGIGAHRWDGRSQGGAGGDSRFGTGGNSTGGGGQNSSQSGNDATGYGAGGAGGQRSGTGSGGRAGGNGTPGVCKITELY